MRKAGILFISIFSLAFLILSAAAIIGAPTTVLPRPSVEYPGLPGNSGSHMITRTLAGAPACQATEISDLSMIDLFTLDRWIYLVAQAKLELLTEEELAEGMKLAKQQCAELRVGLRVTIIMMDGQDTLAEVCAPGNCVRVVIKTESLEGY